LKKLKNSIGLSSVKEKISCIIWHNNEWKGVDLSMLEISNCIIMNVKKATLPVDYFYVGIIFSILIASKYLKIKIVTSAAHFIY